MTRFFVDRPIFANVIAIIMMIAGAVALIRLPVEQYPTITPPTVTVTTVYPGANAKTVAETVAAPIEQQVNGIENMMYMSSTSAADGTYQLTVTFEIGTDIDKAQVLLQNRVAIAQPSLPSEVVRQGIITKKQSTSFVLVVTLTSPKGTKDSLFLSNYCKLRIQDELSRVPGVGDVVSFGGSNYAMRVWLDPEKMKARKLSAQDIIAAIQEQNLQVTAGQIGQPPAPGGQNVQLTIASEGRMTDAEQFANIVVKTGDMRKVAFLRDVARIELGGQVYDQYSLRNGIPAASLGVFQLPGANSLNVGDEIKKVLVKLARDFPEDVVYDIPFDTTIMVEQAIGEVYKTIIEAGVLVLVVILVFLQDWRAVLVPATTVPVTIVGAFAFMAALGFSVNMLTLFGLILAIGIVVDDAIVVVENAAHHIDRGKLDPKTATIKAMDEVVGPIIGITLVLMAVFLPAALLGGITGQLFRQFALTIAATAILSAINAVTLKPAQCAVWLRPTPERKNIFYRWFNAVYGVCERAYTAMIVRLVRFTPAMLLIYAVLIAGTVYGYLQLPTSFFPPEDQGYAVVFMQLPDGASQERTAAVLHRVDDILIKSPGVENVFAIGGFSLLDGTATSNAATFFVVFKPWDQRRDPTLSQDAILAGFRQKFDSIQDAMIFAFAPPAVQGLGNTGGFSLQVEDRANVGLETLEQYVQEIVADGNAQTGVQALNTTFRATVPQLFAEVDRVKAKTIGLRLSDVFATLSTYLGSAYVNDFNKFGRTFQVRVQADHRFRMKPDDIGKLELRNESGEMIPISTVAKVRQSRGPQTISRYNLYPSATINGEAAPGYSSGDALSLMEQLVESKIPNSIGYEWTGMSYQEKRVGGQAFLVFGLSVLLVYLVLAAQYESWLLPAAVILVVPLGLLGATAAVALRGMDVNAYTQIGIVLIIALASKNAILIVEFARELRKKGKSISESAIEAARLRFRPILMTSFAFILGVFPLVFAEGAGAASRQAIGTAVFGGMIASTILAVFFVPSFFVAFQWIAELRKPHPPNATATLSSAH